MIPVRPPDLLPGLRVSLHNDVLSTTDKVWAALSASAAGDLDTVKALTGECAELVYAQYNYTPPVYFAVREGHAQLAEYLLSLGAYSPSYRTYPFLDSLETLALDRGYLDIAEKLNRYAANSSRQRYRGDNGRIHYPRSAVQEEFEQAVNRNETGRVRSLLHDHPGLLEHDTYFWGEGILAMPAKEAHFSMIDLLMEHGAEVLPVLKWARFYHFERTDSMRYLLERGASANTMSWHRITLLHDMAQTGDMEKAGLLLQYGADIHAIDDEYRSTPLGMAVRWGRKDMAAYLLEQGADPKRSGADWSAPLAWARKRNQRDIEQLLERAGA